MDARQVLEETTDRRTEVRREAGARNVRLRATVVIALAVAAATTWFMRSQQTQLAQQTAQAPAGRFSDGPVQVGAAAASTADLPITLDALGTVTPLATVTVRTRIDGQLVQVGFQEGQHVRKGDFLAQIDPRPYQAALEQAEGQLARDQALLRNAEVDLVRYRQLVAEDSIARQTLDTQESLVRQYRATIKVDQGQVNSARLNLAYCRIVSPVEGRVGLRQVDEGNYVQTSDSGGIVVVTQLRPITVVFTIPEDNLQNVLMRTRAGVTLPVTAYDRSGTTKLATGVLTTIDNQIDPSTGTVKLKARFENADERLFPNQFVNVRLLVDTVQGATVIPSAAVQRGSQGTYVYVVSPDGTATARPVTAGASDGEHLQVMKGIEPGERVVTDGVDRLRDGIKVTVPADTKPGIGDQSPGRPAGQAAAGGSQHRQRSE
jgi:multidrug efflux system membrane fusion protein